MASKCRKFVPNMFNKSKCQACFGAKELHSAEALESNKATRKVSKCGYLFVSPDLDFSNPLDRTRKWQRRFFRLYDDGELTFSVDENPDTVPQGSVDMNRCTDVLEAEALTTHSNSIAVVTPEKTEYFKATSKEEMQWWHDVLIEFPNNLKSIKPRRKPNLISNKENVQPVQDGYTSKEVVKSNLEIDRVRQQPAHGSDLPAYATFKGVRSLKHKYDKNHQEGMRKSSSLHDLTSQEKEMASTLASSRFLSCSGDRLDVLSSCRSVDGKQVGALSVSPYFNIPRTSWPSRVHPSNPMLTAPAAHPSLFNSSSSLSSTSSTSSAAHRGLLEDRAAGQMFGTGSKERSRPTRERSASLKDLSTHFTLARDTGSLERGPGSVSSGGLRADGDDLSQSMSADETDGNETDELKDLVYMKKGWLVKQGPSEKESRKHWFVLAGNSLRYFQDAKAEETNALDGRIDLSSCHEVSEVNMARYYGFKIKNKNGEYILAAMTSGIRNNWMKAIRLCMDLHSSRPKLNLSCTLTGKALAGLSARTVDDFDVGSGSHRNSTCTLPTTAVVTGSKGETAFQLVAQQESSKKEQGVRNVRRHHSDVNPMNVGKILSIKEISTNIDTADPALSSCNSSVGPTHPTISASQSSMDLTEKPESVPRGSKIPRHHSSLADAGMWSQAGGPLMNRYVEGSDSIAINPSSQVVESRRSKRNITGESSREEEKREMLHRAKSPSARVKEKSRGAKTPRLHSPPPEDDDFDYHSGQRAGGSASETSQILSDTEDDLDIMVSSEVENLVRRVDQLSSQLANANSTAALQAKLEASSHQPTSTSMSTEIEKQLSQLDKKITFMEKALAGKSPSSPQAAKSRPSLSPQDTQSIMSRLKDMKEQLESTNSGLKEILSDVVSSQVDDFQEASQQQILTSCIDGCGKKIEKLTDMIRGERGGECGSASKNPGGCCGGGGCPDSKDGGGSSGMTQSMQEIKERIQEIGELLDCLDDDAEDSDEEEGETTTVDDVRERLANLCEYVEQHCTFSNYDWHLMQLLTVQKTEASKMRPQQTGGGDGGTDSKDKLQDYVDRLSLEALILVEMAHLLEDKGAQSQVEKEEEGDSVLKVLGVLSSRVLSLHRKLDQECKTLHMEDATSDVLAVQADLIAEKILLEGELSSGTFGQNLQPNEEKDKKVQPKLLATEAIMRTQLDSYIGKNLDKTCEELWSSASHLTLRCLVQGELTFALNCLKKRLSDRVHESKPEGLRDLFFKRLKQRHKLVMDVAEVYENKIIKALAIIVSKESEEMTIVEGPENVLDTVCSEVSTIMEKHIQKYKEKIRSAEDTQSAHQWDMVVNQLRTDRESVLTGIREQHATISPESDGEDNIEVPFQTLDSTINNFGEILSLKSVLSAQIHFIDELLKVGDATLLDDVDFDVEEEEVEECGAEEEVVVQWTLQKGLTSFMQKLTDCLKMEATSRRDQVARLVPSSTRKPSDIVAEIPDVTNLKGDTQYSEGLTREAVFAAQLTFMMCKMKLQHEQELDRLRASRPSRAQQSSSVEGREDGESDLDSLLGPLEDVLDTKYDDEMETLRVVASQVSKLRSAVQGSGSTQNWAQVDEQVQNLEQKLQEELNLAQQRHEAHLDLFKQEEAKVEQAWENVQQEREILEDRCTALETELQSITSQHDDEVERMRQDVLTAVSAIRANEEESEIHLSDQVQRLTKQMLIQKENFQRFLNKAKDCLSEDGKSHESLKQLVEQELKTVSETQLVDVEHSDDEESPPLPSQPPPSLVQRDDKSLKMEEELELLKKEKDEALAEETRNTKAALDAMKKAYEEELQQERDKYKEILTTMYNEDFVNEIRRRYETEVEKSREELKQVKMHYLSKCEDYKLLEIKMGQTKQDYESHINQLIMSNAHLDDMVNQEIDRLKDFIKNRPANLTTGSATLEEELYDAQIMTRVKDAELQKLRSQAKNLENSLHRTTEEHRQTMTQYLQALKENQELRKEYQMETAALRDQLDKLQGESGQRRPIRRAPSFHHRARSPSPQSSASQCKESASSTTEHISRDSNRRRRLDQRDLRRSKSSPSLPYVFDAKGMPTAVKGTSKGGRSVQSKS